jgi:hypothetical protein
VRTHRWKPVHYPGQSDGELYDLEADPWELCNLYGQSGYGDITAALRVLLLDWKIKSEDTLPAPPRGEDKSFQ